MTDITLILHNIRSTHNVGAIFRTAEGFGVKKIIISGYTPYPKLPQSDPRLPHIAGKMTAQIHKTALGAEELVPFCVVDDLELWLEKTRVPIIGLEQDERSTPLPDFSPPKACALILGEEVHGIPKHIMDRCEQYLEIPMHGKKESFNVSVACGIALYALQNAPNIT